jgi:hypothetical protein
MKKFTLLFVAAMFSALSFAALNPYAYGLSSSLNTDQTELTINYSLNATATNVDFVLLDGDKVIKTVNLNSQGLVKGTYTAAIALDDPNMPLGKKLSWKIEVKGAAHNTTNNHGGYQFFHPSGVDVDNNPESPHFGRIICNEAMHSVKSKTGTYLSAQFGAGIFEFTPAFEPIPNGDKPGYNGGITFTNLRPDNNSSTAYAPRRVRISEDGRIFVSSLNTDGHVLWEVNPDNMNEWTEVIAGTLSATDINSVVNSSKTYIGGPNVAMDVRGKGKDLQLAMLSGIGTFQCNEYDLGTATEWDKAPSRKILGNKYIVNYTGSSIEYDNEGGIWFCQYRGSADPAAPAFLHINAKGEVDYLEALANVRAGAFRFNHDFTKVITADGRSAAGTYNQGWARIYDVSKDANGKPVLTLDRVIDMSAMGHTLNDFAWDIADNIYVVGNNKEWIRAYALARTANDIAATPCASKYAFTINSAAQAAKASELNPYAYDLSSELSSDKKTLTIHYALNANAKAVSAVIMNGETEVKSFACTGITRGEHSVAIPTAELPVGLKLTWQIKVDGTSKTKPTQVSTYYSLYCSHGLAIDKNPESEYFGRILAVEGMQAVPAEGYLSSGKGAGIYVFTPEFATDGKVYNGGKDFTRQWATYGYQPWRVKISEDGRIFVSSCDLNGKFVWELSKDLNTWTDVLARGQEKSSSTMKGNAFTTDEGQFLAGMNLSMDVIGSGKDLKLLLYSASGTGITGQTQTLFRLDEYALGEATKWDNSKEPTQITCFSGKYGFMYSNVNIIYDGEGGYWFGASRGGNANQPNLVHFDKNGRRDYYSESAEYYGGDGILLHNGMLIKGKARTDANTGNFGVYTMSKDASGNLVLTEKWSVKANHIGRNLNEFAIDHGENLYVVGNSGEKIIAFAMPYSGSVTTPCAAKYAFELEARGVVKRAVQLGESTIVLTHEADGTPYLYNVVGDVMTPISQNGIVARDPENAGDYLAISDIAVTEDGKLVACNYIMCQSDASKVDAGYKRGVSRFYIWDNLNDNPRVWFTSQMYSNWYRSKQGYTMAVKGTSTNAQIFTTGANGTNNKARFSIYNVKNGIYTEPTSNTNDYYHYHNGASDINTVDMTTVLGANYELSASPWDNMWIMDGNLVEPYEVNVSTTNNVALTNGEALAQGILGKKYNGATYFTIGNLCFMVAPYADASGNVAGVKVLDINHGLASAKVMQTLNLATPVAGIAAATAVKVNGYDLAITLVVDATIYTINTTIELTVTIGEDVDNTTNLAPYIGKTVTATVTRSFNNDSYKTITLPFSMDAAQISDVFGDATVLEFINVIEGPSEINLRFRPTSKIVAGTPYIIALPEGEYDAEDGFTIEDVVIDTELRPITFGDITMQPVLDYGRQLTKTTEYWLATDNYLYNANDPAVVMPGLRAYFISNSPLPIRARVVYEENEETELPIIQQQPENNVRKIMKDGQIIIIRGEQQYNLQGQRID